MLAKLKMELLTDDDFYWYKSSRMQGVIMEHIDPEYASLLHQQGLNPYSQYLEIGEKKYWHINTLTDEAYEKILVPLQRESFVGFSLHSSKSDIKIGSKELETLDEDVLINDFYHGETVRNFKIRFKSPCSFKSNGMYVNVPDFRLLYRSLIAKYGSSTGGEEVADEETVEQLSQNSSLSNYKLRSVAFPMEGIWIPGFSGDMTIHVRGTETMARYAELLFRFGSFSGVGIKTGMGMGAISFESLNKNKRQEGKE